MMHPNLAGSLLLVALAAVLLAAAAAKTVEAGRGRLDWPDATLAGMRIPAAVVITAEAAAGACVVVLAARPAAVILAVMYGLLSIAAVRLRGRVCGCFGVRSSVVGPGHIVGTVVGCVLATAVASTGTGWNIPVGVRGGALVGLAAAVVVAVRLHNRHIEAHRRAERDRMWATKPLAGAASIVIYTRPDCPHCASLRLLLDGMIDERLLRWVELADEREDDTPARYEELADGAVPTAIPVDHTGQPVAGPYRAVLDICRLVELFVRVRNDHDRSRVPATAGVTGT